METVRFRVAGEAIEGERHAPSPRAKVRGGLLLVHGFNGWRIEFWETPRKLAAAGFHVLNFDQRGFGRSDGERGRTSVERALEDIGAAAALLRRLAGPRASLGIVGHSLGGSYTLAALGRLKGFQAAAVAHPVNRLFDELGPVERGLYHWLGRRAERRVADGKEPGTVRYRIGPRHLFVDRAAARQAALDGIVSPRVNLGNYRAALAMDASAWAGAVRSPVLCILGPRDRVVRPEHSRQVYDALPEPKALLEHRGGHSCFRDLDADLVTAALIAWFSNHLGR